MDEMECQQIDKKIETFSQIFRNILFILTEKWRENKRKTTRFECEWLIDFKNIKF